jgi:hypothetical protein
MTDATISKMETPTGQEETAILLEEYERRIATLQESLKQAGRANQSEAVILQERDDLRRRLENAEMLLERLKEENYPPSMNLLEAYVAATDWEWIINAGYPEFKDTVIWFRKLAEGVIEKGKSREALIDNTTAKQPEGITKLGKALQNIDVTKRVLVENSCPSEFGLEDCEFNPETLCSLCCKDCWNEEVGE